ncbi:hypothetical protein AFE02nite_04680 [Actinotalea fermentans]|uniref:Deoxyuridine 5'-triphosphate nucleotidohydrolase n=1 Tax=Actinotalea fermentans TaxID=43671 RepID=A0A511YU62_9CELL|nr:hypothetical protein AFE02nite_04680 [Actinotalea fermentans]
MADAAGAAGTAAAAEEPDGGVVGASGMGPAWQRPGARAAPAARVRVVSPANHLPGGDEEAVEVLLVMTDDGLPEPTYAHPGDAGADLVTAVDVVLPPLGRATVPTGVRIALPDGYAAFVHPRSGLAARHGLTVVNAPGTVDAGYRGEIQVTLLNTDAERPVELRRGDRIAQLVVQRVERARFVRAERLPGSHRGEGGFGSSGGWRGEDAAPPAVDA